MSHFFKQTMDKVFRIDFNHSHHPIFQMDFSKYFFEVVIRESR